MRSFATVPSRQIAPWKPSLVDLVATAIPGQGELPDELGLDLEGLEHLDDEALWKPRGAAWRRSWGAWRNCITNGRPARGSPRPKDKPLQN